MENEIQNSISTNELYKEYDWYQNTFPKLVKDACDDFFASNFDIEFVGLSKNINCLLDNEACFVTKIRINKDYDVYLHLFRLSFALSIIGIQIEIMFTIVRLEHVYNLVPQMCW